MRLLAVIALVGCGGSSPKPPPASPVTDPISAWLARIPESCRAETPIAAVQCAAPTADPPGACVVEMRDLETGTVVDRYVFAGSQLVRLDRVLSDVMRISQTRDYDSAGRLARERSCLTSSGGGGSWAPSWRPQNVIYESPTTIVDVTERTYATPASRVPAFATTTSTTSFEGKVVTTDIKRCYAFDRRGRRTERFQVYRDDARPELFDTQINTYDHGDAGVVAINYATLNLDRIAGAYSVRHQSSWTARFSYNTQRLVSSVEASDSKTTYRYDHRGRLTSYGGSVSFAWDDAGRLLALTGIGDGDRTYRYDAAGRIDEARYASGGYRVTYGAGCPATFTHAEIMPSTDSYQYYEGKDSL